MKFSRHQWAWTGGAATFFGLAIWALVADKPMTGIIWMIVGLTWLALALAQARSRAHSQSLGPQSGTGAPGKDPPVRGAPDRETTGREG